MSNLNSIFEIGRRALGVQQAALDRTSHNIANVNTEGYSRQRVNLRSDRVMLSGNFPISGGVSIESVERMRDKFIDQQIRVQSNTLGWFNTYKSAFERLETIINEPSNSGIGSAMTNFFDAWAELANDPEGAVSRQAVLMRGEALSSAFGNTYSRITQFKSEIYSDFATKVGEFNDMLDELADINRLTANSGNSILSADLLDRRDVMLQKLSEMADLKVTEQDNGSVMISQNGNVILQNVSATHLVAGDPGANLSETRWENENSAAGFSNGEFAAYIELYDARLDEVLGQLDTLADSIVSSVNNQHRLGSSTESTPTSGYYFFDPNSEGAGKMMISSDIKNDIGKISASLDGNSGDGSNALRISQLVNEGLLLDGTTRFHDFFANTVSTVGAQSAHFQTMAEGQELFVDQLTTRQEEISSVSLDEEMTNLIEFQRAYQAAARIITTVDEMMDTLINTL